MTLIKQQEEVLKGRTMAINYIIDGVRILAEFTNAKYSLSQALEIKTCLEMVGPDDLVRMCGLIDQAIYEEEKKRGWHD